ncbi:MAG TPA: LysR family transcriptional regulator [Opitutaceae bacterium]|nr:LysR family transcriptional regulator [Opitutaceae bacterium]
MKEIIDSRQLRAFVAVARRGSFTHGAKDVFITQSAASHAIRSLEDELGCRLFERVGKRAMLSQAGEHLLRHCEEILRNMRDARGELRALKDWGHGRLRLGAPATVCQHLLPGILRELRERHPRCALNIESGDNPQLLAFLRGNRIDVALMIEPERQPEVEFDAMFTDELCFIVPADHPWVARPAVTREELADATLILAGKATRTFTLVEDYFRAHHLVLPRCIELGSVDSIKELVKTGLGVGIAAPWPVRRELEAGELVALPLGPERLRRRWGVARLRGRRLGLAEETFIRYCREQTAVLAAGALRPRRPIAPPVVLAPD